MKVESARGVHSTATQRPLGPLVTTIALSALALTVLFGMWTVWGIRAVRKTLVEEARQDALALLESLVLAAQYNVATGALVDQLETEAQASRARFIAGAIDPDQIATLEISELTSLAESGGVTIWAEGGATRSFPSELSGLIGRDSALAAYDWSEESAGAVELSVGDTSLDIVWDGTGVPTEWGGIALWNHPEAGSRGPSYGGIGELIQQIAGKSGVNYIMLQSPDGIVFASRPLKPVLRLVADSFLVAALENNLSATREIEFEGQPILEAVAPFLSTDLPSGMFRVGTSLAGVVSAQDRLTLQLGFSAILFLLMSTAVIAFLINRRSLSDLGRSYRRVETMTTRILDSMDQGVVAVDGEGRITAFNPAAEEITGQSSDDVLGAGVADVLGEGDYDLSRVGTVGEAVRDREIRLPTSEGVKDVVYTTTPMVMPDGTAHGAVSVVRDETEARALSERVRRAERLSEMGHLAAGVAHEIRNPLNAIALAAQRLRMEAGDEEARGLASTVWDESKRLNAIIEDYLSLARPSQPCTDTVDLTTLVEEVSQMVSLEAQKEAVALDVRLTEGTVNVLGLVGDFKKALWNILTNAVAATRQGGRVTVTLKRENKQVKLTVDDTGSGIAPEDISRVFQPYFTTKTGGTGLGLAITHRIITDHQGTIDIASPVPESGEGGTRVTITLPMADV